MQGRLDPRVESTRFTCTELLVKLVILECINILTLIATGSNGLFWGAAGNRADNPTSDRNWCRYRRPGGGPRARKVRLRGHGARTGFWPGRQDAGRRGRRSRDRRRTDSAHDALGVRADICRRGPVAWRSRGSEAGANFGAPCLERDERLDLYADATRSATAIGTLAGAAEARRYIAFCERARAIYETLKKPFILSAQPTPLSLTFEAGLAGLADLWRISPFSSLWRELGTYFHDPRLRQLFGRYATYCGSSPFAAPATLMLIAHVEREGVWLAEGGMHTLAEALARAAARHGAIVRYRSEVMQIVVDRGRAQGVVLTTGERLRAMQWSSMRMQRHSHRGFSGALRSGRSMCRPARDRFPPSPGRSSARPAAFPCRAITSSSPRIMLRSSPSSSKGRGCPRGRRSTSARKTATAMGKTGGRSERLLMLVNAPPTGDLHPFPKAEIEECRQRAFALLEHCGLAIDYRPGQVCATTPADFDRLFPGSGGALYGQATHGWSASFSRPTARTRIPRLYLAGGAASGSGGADGSDLGPPRGGARPVGLGFDDR